MNERGVRPYRSVASKTLEPPASAAAGPGATAAACIGVRAGARCAAAMGRTGSRGVVGVRGHGSRILRRRGYAYTEIEFGGHARLGNGKRVRVFPGRNPKERWILR